METKTLSEEAVETHVIDVFDPKSAVMSAMRRAQAELYEKAVLANAEGWQSGPVEVETYERPYDLAVVVRLSMVMTRE